MFGYKLIKTTEFERLQKSLDDAQRTIETQAKRLADMGNKIKEQEEYIANLTKPVQVEEKAEKSDKPVKKVRRRSSKKNTKKEE